MKHVIIGAGVAGITARGFTGDAGPRVAGGQHRPGVFIKARMKNQGVDIGSKKAGNQWLSAYRDEEQEVLLAMGEKFRVVKVHKGEYEWQVVLEPW